MSGGPSTCTSMIAAGMFSQYRAIERIARSRTSLRRRIPIATCKRVRHVLGEDAHRVHAARGHARVVRGLKIQLAPEPLGQPARPGSVDSRTATGFLESGVLIWPRWWGICVPGRALKLGSSVSAMFSLTVQPVCGTSSTRARQAGSAASPSRARVDPRVGV